MKPRDQWGPGDYLAELILNILVMLTIGVVGLFVILLFWMIMSWLKGRV